MAAARLAGVVLALGAAVSTACGERPDGRARVVAVLTGAHAPATDAAGAPAALDSPAVPLPDPLDDPVLRLAGGDTVHVHAEVAGFYRDRRYAPVWTDGSGVRREGEDLVAALSGAAADGLDPSRYRVLTAARLRQRVDEAEDDGDRSAVLGDLDLLLSESFVRLAQDLVRGTIDPRRAGLEWQIDPGDAPLGELLASAAATGPRTVLEGLRPRAPEYARMRAALARLRQASAAGGWGTVSAGSPLSVGDRDPRVGELRRRLIAGLDPTERQLAERSQRDPYRFDPALGRALRHFQERHTLYEDGALGPNTTKALNVPVAQRIDALRLNLDRWRWLPSDLGDTYLLVNVAGFELEVVRGDSVVQSMDVVVGRTADRTPIFEDTLESMVVNPYWNVPPRIAEEEILPEMEDDPLYLERNHFEVDERDGEMRIRQTPGPWNALGHVKFLFPNNHDIYLHDTPADHLFSQETRAFSHGCIRLQHPDSLARTLLSMLTDRPASDYDRLRRSGREEWVRFDRKIPVYIVYFTAWVGDHGEIRFHPDIYSRDRTLAREQMAKLGTAEGGAPAGG